MAKNEEIWHAPKQRIPGIKQEFPKIPNAVVQLTKARSTKPFGGIVIYKVGEYNVPDEGFGLSNLPLFRKFFSSWEHRTFSPKPEDSPVESESFRS